MNQTSSDDRREFARRVLRGSAITVTVILAVVLFVFEGRVLFVLLAGVLFALFLEGTCGFLARRTRVPYKVVLGILATSIAASMLFGSYFLGAAIAVQASSFAEQVPRAWSALVEAVHHRPALAEVVGPLAQKAPTGSADLAKVVTGATGIAEMLGVVGVVFFLGVYGAAQPRSYTNVVVSLVPLPKRARAEAILQEIGSQLTRWICGRVIAMAMVGVCVGTGLALMHVPLALPLGVVAGFLAFIEYLGSVASAAPAMLLAFTRSPIFAVWVALLFLGVHLVEGYVLTPLLARQMIRIPPAYMLGTQVVLGEIFGVAGLTFATPLVVVATILVRRLYVEDALGDHSGSTAPERRRPRADGRASRP
jgi:predicted PurR-regulated permease PerM